MHCFITTTPTYHKIREKMGHSSKSTGASLFEDNPSLHDMYCDYEQPLAGIDSDATTAITDYSSGSDVVEQHLHEMADNRRQCSLSDARFALSYVKRKMMKKREIAFDDDNSSKLLDALKLKHRTLSSGSSSETTRCSSLSSSEAYSSYYSRRSTSEHTSSSFSSVETRCSSYSSSSSSKTYSSFFRPEKKVVCHKMELFAKDDKSTFNIYSSDVDFIEHPFSVSLIEDTPVRVVPADDDHRRHRSLPSKVMYPLLPPTKPPPLLRLPCQWSDSDSFSSHHSDDGDVSIVTRVEKGDHNMSGYVVDFEKSDDCCGILSRGI